MALDELFDWIQDHYIEQTVWYLKRLSANDTQQNKSHQAGSYIPLQVAFEIAPALDSDPGLNPRVELEFFLDSHHTRNSVSLIYYNNRKHGRTRKETRMTGFGGQSSPLLDPDHTGQLIAFVFHPQGQGLGGRCHAWLCGGPDEEDLLESFVEPVDPGQSVFRKPGQHEFSQLVRQKLACTLERAGYTEESILEFPTPEKLVEMACKLRRLEAASADDRLIKRRDCEFELFREIEARYFEPLLKQVGTNFDDFLVLAQRVLQRRKARSGLSLELHLKFILEEEGFKEGEDYAYKVKTERQNEPDFLFPSLQAYLDPDFPEHRLHMLAVKTTCKDRWRQVLTEADRIDRKHLLTLQEGVSNNQFSEMKSQNLTLVVPERLHSKYNSNQQAELQTLEQFITALRIAQRSS